VSLVRFIGVLATHRYLLLQLTRRAFTARHAGTVLGWGWSLVTTLVQFGILWFVFGRVLGVRVGADGTGNFALYLLAGLVPFLALSDAVLRSAGLLRQNAALVCRVRFPVEVLVVGDVLASAAHQALAMVLVIGLCAVKGVFVPASVGWLLGGGAVVLLWMVGLGLVVAAAGAFLPDLGEGLGLGMQVVFYGAPIVYPLSLVPGGWMRTLVEANPVTQIAGAARAALLGMAPPRMGALVALAVAGVALVWIGEAVVERYRLRFADVL